MIEYLKDIVPEDAAAALDKLTSDFRALQRNYENETSNLDNTDEADQEIIMAQARQFVDGVRRSEEEFNKIYEGRYRAYLRDELILEVSVKDAQKDYYRWTSRGAERIPAETVEIPEEFDIEFAF